MPRWQLTCRPTFHPPWSFRAHVSLLTLGRLPPDQTAQMVTGVAGGKTLPPEVLQQDVIKSDGVPLFVEELTRIVLESGLLQEHKGQYALVAPLTAVAIPSTLQDSLMARLDRLTTAKSVAQLGATLGRVFSYEVLRAVSPLHETTLQYELTRLVAGELLYQRGVPPQATYVFKHVLIQEVAYQSLLRSTRQQYHRRIAPVLEALFPETVETQPELPAQHHTEAGLSAQAIPYWQRAGQRAFQRSANLEAVAHLTTGLALLATLPETPARVQQELDLQIALGPALMATRGYAAPEVERVYTRARQLCQQVGEMPQLFRVLWGLWLFYFVRAQLQSAYELGEQLLTHAQRAQDSMLLIEAQRALGATLWFLGEFVTAQRYLEQGTTLYDLQQHRSLAFMYGQDPKVTCLSYAAWALWVRGYPEQALRRSHEALSLAQELRAAMSLSRLWQQQGKCQEAHTLLAPIYGWFTEGFDTTDLQEARALLEELGGSGPHQMATALRIQASPRQW